MDAIVLKGIRAEGAHGVLHEERASPQPFEVDLRIEADLDVAARTDDLTETVDYAGVVSKVAALIEGESFDLIETLADRIAGAVLADPRVVAVEVSLRKLAPAVGVEIAWAGVELRRVAAPEAGQA